jgi:hypothetical protein
MSEAALEVLVVLLDRVRARSRSTWPALVNAQPDDEARGHEAFAELEARTGALPEELAGPEDPLVESSPRIKVLPHEPALEAAGDADDEAPVLEVLAERALGDVAEERVADEEPLLAHVSLGELLEASLALRPRQSAW